MALPLEPGSEGAAGQAEDPGRKGRVPPKRLERGEHVHEDFLRGLLGIRPVAQALVEKRIDPLEVALIELIEGGTVALTDAVDQVFVRFSRPGGSGPRGDRAGSVPIHVYIPIPIPIPAHFRIQSYIDFRSHDADHSRIPLSGLGTDLEVSPSLRCRRISQFDPIRSPV